MITRKFKVYYKEELLATLVEIENLMIFIRGYLECYYPAPCDYLKIVEVEEIENKPNQLVDKETPKDGSFGYSCPNCRMYCPSCGQALDWGDDND